MNKPEFNPNQPFEPSKPEFDASKPFDKGSSDAFAAKREAIEPGVMGETEPVEQKLLNNVNAAGAGIMLPDTALGLAKMAGIGDAAETGAKYAGRFGENQMGRLHGTSAAQFRQLGREGFSPTMRASYDMGDANLGLGPIGRSQAINERVAGLGSDIEDVRNTAASAGPGMTPQAMADKIRAAKGADYAPGGSHFEGEGAFNENLDNISKMPEGGINSFAERASDMHRNAAGNKLVLPAKSTAQSDIANQMSHFNDEEIAGRLSPDEAGHYDQLKEQFGYAKNLQPMEMRGEGREATAKGASTAFGMAKDLAHSLIGGPKLGAQAGFGAESVLNTVGSTINAAKPTFGGVTANLMQRLSSNPQSLGQYAAPLLKAAQEGGSQGVAATHYILSTSHPRYNMLINGQGDDEDAQ